jgi:hypothetical protein
MADYKSSDLVLRCYGRKVSDGQWYGVCVDLNIAAEAGSKDEMLEKIGDMVKSYLEAVIDTDDPDSIPHLLKRPAPLKDWVAYYLIKLLISISNLRDNFVFKKSIPFHFAHNG